MVAGEIRLPLGSAFAQFFFGFPLECLLDFIDAGYRRAYAAHFALVLAADDFLEYPLDHESDGVRRTTRRGGGNTRIMCPVQVLGNVLQAILCLVRVVSAPKT